MLTEYLKANQTKLTEVLKALGSEFVGYYCDGLLIGAKMADGAGFYFGVDKENRLTISAKWPEFTGAGGRRHFYGYSTLISYGEVRGYREINISLDKTPERIASEIRRRFLPAFLSAWGFLNARLLADQRYATDACNSENFLRGALGSGDRSLTYCLDKDGSYVSAEVEGSKVSLKLSHITPEQAAKFIALWKSTILGE